MNDDTENTQRRKEITAKYRRKNKERIRQQNAEYYKKNAEKLIKKSSSYRSLPENKKRILARHKERMETEPLYCFRENLRNTLRKCLRGSKNRKTESILGLSIEKFRLHLESLWLEGMSWENYGMYGWHIDHIIPLASAKTPEEMKKLWHYQNMQPLWAKDNLAKGSKTTTS
jgi:hypothetical protein